jgi:hypothetical protein
VKVYAGVDPVSGQDVWLRETVKARTARRETEREAEKALTRLLNPVDERRNPRTTATVNQLLDRWVEVIDVARRTHNGYVRQIERHLRPTIGHLQVGRVNAETIDALYASLRRCRDRCGGRKYIDHRTTIEHKCDEHSPRRKCAKVLLNDPAATCPWCRRVCRPHVCEPLSPASVRVLHSILRGALSRAVRWGWIAVNPDKLDVSEALGHEMAIACIGRQRGKAMNAAALSGHLPFRDLIGNPFAPERRAIVPAIATLTIRLRRHPQPPTFLLHWRDPARVATAGGTYDVIPAGEFQPSSVAMWDRRSDFDLWRNIVREYAEELLGEPEHDGTRSTPIDYGGWPLYRKLDQALVQGTASAHLLGLGLDALTLAAAMLTVVVIDDDVFDRTFGDAVQYNDEGEIVSVGHNRSAEGIPFTRESVERLLATEPMASSGAACLALAWQHRSSLGL